MSSQSLMYDPRLVFADIAVTACSVIFCIFLIIVYFSKKNVNNIENKIYKYLLGLNLLNSLTHLIFIYFYSLSYLQTHYNLMLFIDRFRLIFMLIYYFILASYIIIVTFGTDSKIYKIIMKNSKFYFIGIPLIISIIQYLLPMECVIYKKVFTNIGPGNTYWFIIALVLIIVCFSSIIVNRKRMDRKKLIPFYTLLLLSIICMFFSIMGSVIQLTATLVSYLMYHTIENPDMKLITELEFAKDQAEKSNNAKSDFLSSMSHELRTPLNAIVGLSQLIVTSDNLDEIHSDGQDILKSSNNLLELVDSILDINKIDSNNMEIVEKNYNPIEVFNDLEKITRMRIGDKKIELNTRYSDRIPTTLFGDKDKVKTIINNILTNAVKYTNEGFVEFNVDCTIKDDICNLRITITDSGRGISEDQMNNLFTKFYRLEEDKDSDIEGTGLGLALTKALLDLMGGKITINSEEGIGSTFTITLCQKIVNNTESDTEVL